ncbi:carbohydrate ABC transporter permease [Cohnella thailandensis]|uniref:Sugar ABC transporter permease n=1 Tax=Cohnella thailandensis TaxID=557557 RepID=A0A841SVF4_9BACL|nr:sugar ABC transporter permease [Cohnella thailandensis]MBB6636283.1 sugar ABC transporter permease [Cohnella thailandensis]MBP1973748.1 raffinose/stachyose/melibiose transport system permease protein [Cohnella thailandensis]
MRKSLFEAIRQTVFMGPAVLVYVTILLIPLLLGLYYSMTDWDGASSSYSWVGFGNYKEALLDDPDFVYSFWFTIKMTLVIALLMNLIGFGLAFLLTKKLRFRNLWRAVFFLPNVLGGLILGFLWNFIFTKVFEAIGEATNWPLFAIAWLGNEHTAFWSLVIVSVWHGLGYVMIIYIAGLVNIPTEIREAAQIDGATGWQSLTRITLPLIMASVTICLFWTISSTLRIFDLNYSLTAGGPFGSTESVAMNIYYEAFRDNNFGLGSAKAVIFFLVVVVITAVQVILTKRKEVEA